MFRRPGGKKGGDKNGMVLIVSLWIILALAGTVLAFARSVRVEMVIAANKVAEARAEWIALGGLEYVIALIDNSERTGSPGSGSDFEAVSLGEGYFWVLMYDDEYESFYTFGIGDESAKLNINHADMGMLAMLPGMEPDFAASVVDWRNPEEVSSAGGAKSEYYLLLSPPYICKSGPFDSVEELLLVRGASMEVMFGRDLNRNGVVDYFETDEGSGFFSGDIFASRGIAPFVTVHTTHANIPASESELVNINRAGSARMRELLSVAAEGERLNSLILRAIRNRPYESALDFFFRAGLTVDEFRQVAPEITMGDRGRRSGLVNVNTASPEVLLCLPSMEPVDVELLISRRSDADVDKTNIAWVAEVLEPEKAAAAGGWMTVTSYQYSADIVAVSGDGRAFKRLRAVIDARTSPPSVVSLTDLTGLGWPLEQEILAGLRQGGILSSEIF